MAYRASGAIQFWGIDSMLQAYDARGIAPWSLWQGKQLLTAGLDKQTLVNFLGMLGPGQSLAVYTLKVHKGEECADDIDSLTPFNGSFNFKLNESAAGGSGGNVGGAQSSGVGSIMQRKMEEMFAAKMEKMLARLDDEDDEEEEEPETIGSIITGFLKEPEKLVAIINGVRGLMSGNGMQAVQMGNIKRVGAPITQEAEFERVGIAYETLKANDPDILNHLEKLARISGANPQMFKMLLSSLDNM